MFVDPGLAPVTETSLSVYFRERLLESARCLEPSPQEDTCWYLGSLLERFCRSDHLFAYEDGQMALRPLALLYGDALEAPSERERCLLLQQLGDMALFLGALFPERFTRRGIQQDNIVGMGGGAYDYLAGTARANRHIFAELANTFTRMLELVANACSQERQLGASDIIALYQRWLETGDELTGNQLVALGIDLSGSTKLQ